MLYISKETSKRANTYLNQCIEDVKLKDQKATLRHKARAQLQEHDPSHQNCERKKEGETVFFTYALGNVNSFLG